jgi:hypothetical protein
MTVPARAALCVSATKRPAKARSGSCGSVQSEAPAAVF